MKSSRFNVVTNYPLTGELLLFNTLRGAFTAVEPGKASTVHRLLENPATSTDAPALAEYLYKQGFLLDDSCDEIAIVEQRSRLGINDTNRLDVIIMPNMNCNLACTYCYERHEQSAMSDQTTASLIAWLEQMVPKFKVVLISWFGGEPLLSYKTVFKVQSIVRQLCADHDVEFSSHITTNGYALTPDKAQGLVDLDLLSYQVTLDGTAGIHNQMRPRRDGGKSFDRIFKHVCSLAANHPTANIKLRINYNQNNIDLVPDLLHSFPLNIRSQLNIVLERIFGEEYSNFEDAMSPREIGLRTEKLNDLARNLGYQVTVDSVEHSKFSYCYADRKSQFVINYNGDIFKCTVDKFRTEDRLGALKTSGEILWEGDRLTSWHDAPAFEDKCYKCSFMPMCMGGCRKTRLREGKMSANCHAPFAGFDRRIQQMYARERGESLVDSFYELTQYEDQAIPITLLDH